MTFLADILRLATASIVGGGNVPKMLDATRH